MADQRSCPVWNFRCKPLAKSSARIVLLEHDSAEPLHADGGGACGKGRKRSVAEAGLEGERDAADEGQESLFTGNLYLECHLLLDSRQIADTDGNKLG